MKNNQKEIKVNPDVVTHFLSKKHGKLWLLFSKIWAKFHLLFICPRCPPEKRKIRDIYDEGKCFWYHNWKHGNYDIPLWMGFDEWKRIRKEQKKQCR